MSKFCGAIGFAETIEDPPGSGVAVGFIAERTYYGDILRRNVTNESQGVVNPSLNINNEISIICDNYILNNVANMRYITYLGSPWELRTISIEYPRMNITLGGLYNGPTAADEPSGGETEGTPITPEAIARKAGMVSKS